LIASENRFAIMHELRGSPEPPLEVLLSKLSAVDLVLIEGFKRAPHPKIEVFRQANGKEPMHPKNASVVAIASDSPFLDAARPVLPLDDAPAIADKALQLAVAPSAVDWRHG
jgi:molybdopterin-guanine dinucleotide biosynthesis adapter protein